MLASLGRHSYIAALGLAVAGCPGPGTVVPAGSFVTAGRAEFETVARATAPARHEVIRFRWRSEDSRLSLSGSGAARIAPPDSMRFDMAASLGIGRATIILAGEAVEASPPELVDQLLPDRFALWSALGFLRAPDGDRIEVLRGDERTWWRVSDARGRVTTFELNAGTLVGVRREEGGRLAAVLTLERDPAAGGRVRRARLEDHLRQARLVVDITAYEASEPFDEDTWRLRP